MDNDRTGSPRSRGKYSGRNKAETTKRFMRALLLQLSNTDDGLMTEDCIVKLQSVLDEI
jgi:hypothetical protein